MAKLEYKLEITGTIEVLSGLHIGGSDVDLNIGGIDSEVAKDKDGNPYIPGSSISGKLRNLIADSKGYKYLNFEAARTAGDIESKSWDREYLALLFSGNGFNIDIKPKMNNKNKEINYWCKILQRKMSDYRDLSNNKVTIDNKEVMLSTHTRLLIRDALLIDEKPKEEILEDKAENLINRNTGGATPRHIERVVSGTKFKLKMVLDIYQHDNVKALCETLHLGINLLNNDYLGGMGSRGSGEVKITIDEVQKLEFENGTINRQQFDEYKFNN